MAKMQRVDDVYVVVMVTPLDVQLQQLSVLLRALYLHGETSLSTACAEVCTDASARTMVYGR